MDLFVINRFWGEEVEEVSKDVKEKEQLTQLLEKIQQRKQQREKADGRSSDLPETLTTGHKRKKKKQVTDSETQVAVEIKSESPNESGPKKKKKKHKDADEKCSTEKKSVRDDENDAGNADTSLGDDSAKPVEKDNADTTYDTTGFTVIGNNNLKKRQKVKRVLPHWLANPTVVSTNLKHLNTSVNDITELDDQLVQKLRENNITHFFPVQSQVIPWLLSSNRKLRYWPRDICVSAPTGSGKTLAYVLPIVQALKRRVVPQIRALVVLPGQDLAQQVYRVFTSYCAGTRLRVVFAAGQNSILKEQKQLIRKSTTGYQNIADIFVTTPGRLVDHIQKTPGFSLQHLRYMVIDEADRVMEDIQDDWLYHTENHIQSFSKEPLQSGRPPPLTVAAMHSLRPPPQKLLFSATLSQDPEKLQQLGLFQPKLFTSVVVTSNGSSENQGTNITGTETPEIRGNFVGKYTTPAELEEKFVVCDPTIKPLILYHLITKNQWKHVLCFTNSKQATHRLFIVLSSLSGLKVKEISSALKRVARDKVLKKFAEGKVDIIVSTDSLARGMDIPGVDYVISYDPPKYVKTYIHRIGRTGRAGREGVAVTLLVDKENGHFQQILQTAGKETVTEITVDEQELEPLEDQYKVALNALKTTLMKEQQDVMEKQRAKKRLVRPSKKHLLRPSFPVKRKSQHRPRKIKKAKQKT